LYIHDEKRTNMVSASCCECNQLIEIEPIPEIGQVVKCKHCNNVFEVTWLFPLRIDCREDIERSVSDQSRENEDGLLSPGETIPSTGE
jgi:hypothetical protein